jgi:hypothetical protein
MDKVIRTGIIKILEEYDNDMYEAEQLAFINTDLKWEAKEKAKEEIISSLTSLIIKWLEGKKREVTPVNYDYKGLVCPYCNTAIPNEEVYVCNQLITELIGEVR